MKRIRWVMLILMICGVISIPVMVLPLIFGYGIHGSFEFLKGIGLVALMFFVPMFFWEKAKRSEYAGILCASVVIGEVCAFIKNADGILNFITVTFICTIVVFIVTFIIFMVVQYALKEGKYEFKLEKQDYYRLREKNVNEFTAQEQTRFKYLESHKKEFDDEFKPKRISVG